MRKVKERIMLAISIGLVSLEAVCVLGDGISETGQSQWPKKRVTENFKEAVKQVLPKQIIFKKQRNKSQIISEGVARYLEQMSMEEKIGQLFIIALDADEEGNGETVLDEAMKEKIQKTHVGGVILFKNNIIDQTQTKVLIEMLQESSKIPLFISVDEEGGRVSRVGSNENINAQPFMAAGEIGKTGDPKKAYEEASRMGKLLKTLGFNMDFAPCGDIYNNPINTVIGNRSFGTSAQCVTPMMIAFAKGLKNEGVFPVMKHYPGHGNTIEDSHDGLAYVYKSLEQLEKEELIPFVEGGKAGIDGMMKGHLLVRDLDDVWPVSLSEKWHDYIAENVNADEMLFITDALNMGAVVNNYGEEEVILRGFLAGNDILLMPTDIEKAEEVIAKAYESGIITEEAINHSVRKILTKKVEQNILLIS